MDFNEYQKAATETAVYPSVGNNMQYPTIGLAGEAGEAAEKIGEVIGEVAISAVTMLRMLIDTSSAVGHVAEAVKKCQRDFSGAVDVTKRDQIKKELGDVLWYIANLAREFNIPLNDIAEDNVAKLRRRREEGTLHGSGDNR